MASSRASLNAAFFAPNLSRIFCLNFFSRSGLISAYIGMDIRICGKAYMVLLC